MFARKRIDMEVSQTGTPIAEWLMENPGKPSGKRANKTNWKDPPFYSWENSLIISTGPFSIANCWFTEGTHISGTIIWKLLGWFTAPKLQVGLSPESPRVTVICNIKPNIL